MIILTMISCETSVDNDECSELLKTVYFKGFKGDSFNDLNVYVEFTNGDIKSVNYSHSGLRDLNGNVSGIQFNVNEVIDFENSKLVFKFDDNVLELSSVVYDKLERYTMFTVVNECEISEYKINGIDQFGSSLEVLYRYLDDYKKQKSH